MLYMNIAQDSCVYKYDFMNYTPYVSICCGLKHLLCGIQQPGRV